MTTKEMIEVMQASLEGKQIQYRVQGGEWINAVEPEWDWKIFEYRVKPEPKYRPFDSAKEVMEAIVEHGYWVISKNKRNKVHINGCCEEFVLITEWRDYNTVFENYTFLDGTPFGKLEE